MELLRSSTSRGIWPQALLLACALTLLAGQARADSETTREYQIKAAFLLNFVKFIEWPPGAFADASSPICLGVLGDDPLGPALDEIVRGETIHDRPLEVLRSQRMDDLKKCHLVFICRSERNKYRDELEILKNSPVVTVSDIEGFADDGGVIQFYLDDRKVRFEINLTVAKRLDLKMSSQLLALGKIAGP